MTVRAVEGKNPYTGGKAIEIDEDKVISLRLRAENNLIIYDEGDDEIYVDLQLDDEIRPTDAFPVGVTTGRVIIDNGWDVTGTVLIFKTTSGDYVMLLYGDDGKVYVDNGTGSLKQIYLKSEVDALIQDLTTYINTELAKKQDILTAGANITIQDVVDPVTGEVTHEISATGGGATYTAGNGIDIDANNNISNTLPGPVVSSTAPSNPTQGAMWYDTTVDVLKLYNGTNWLSVNTQSPQPAPFTPGVNTIYYFPFESDATDHSGNGYTLTNAGTQETVGRSFTSSTEFNTLVTNAKFCCGWIRIDIRGSGGGGGALNTFIQFVGGINGAQMDYCPYNERSTGNDCVQGWYGSSSNIDKKVNSTEGQRFHLAMYYDNGDFYMYINGVKSLVGTGTPGYTWGGLELVTIPSGQTAKYILSEIIVEDRLWTDQEVSDYFNATKSNYGIS